MLYCSMTFVQVTAFIDVENVFQSLLLGSEIFSHKGKSNEPPYKQGFRLGLLPKRKFV